MLAFAACDGDFDPLVDDASDLTTVSQALNSVSTGGSAYATQCSQNGVPLPVPFSTANVGTGNNKWTQRGSFFTGYTESSDTKTIFTMSSSSPAGVCAINASAVNLMSVICQGATGKACFWEAGNTYWTAIGRTTGLPPTPSSNPITIAGANAGINFPSAPDPGISQCTSCHAGENVFLTHMDAGHATNQHSLANWMPTDNSHWTDPIVPSWWVQNAGPSTSEYPASCLACHTTPASVPLAIRGGRLPTLRTAAYSATNGAAYCTILKQVVNLPPSQGGMPLGGAECTPDVNCPLQTDPAVQAMVAACGQAAPNAPTNLTATAGNVKVTLNWTRTAGIPLYNVYRGTSAGGQAATPIATNVGSPTYLDTSVTNGTKYYYKVAATNGTFISAKSNEASATPSAGGIRINCGDNGAFPPFVADQFFSGGAGKTRAVTISTSGVTNPAPLDVYKSQRFASPFSYTIPGLAAGSSHLVRLHFAETNPANNAPNKRKFSVAINGTTQISNLDLFAVAGLNHAYIREFTLNANSSGQYVISFTASLDSATISGIEVL